jgi:hypothetical protein
MRGILAVFGLMLLAGLLGWALASGGGLSPANTGLEAQAVDPTVDTAAGVSQGDLYTLLKRLDSENQPWTLHFAVPLDTGDRSHTMNATGAVIGADYFCYGEPWNTNTRYHCTPFSNIVSVTFED